MNRFNFPAYAPSWGILPSLTLVMLHGAALASSEPAPLQLAALGATATILQRDDASTRGAPAVMLAAASADGNNTQHQAISVLQQREERFKSREQVARTYERSGQLIKAFLEAEDMLQDTGIGSARKSQVASVLAQTMAIAGESQRSEKFAKMAREFAQAASNDEIELIETEPILEVMKSESVLARRSGKNKESLAIIREAFELGQALTNNTQLSNRRRDAALFTQINLTWEYCLQLGIFGRRDEALAIALDQRRRISTLTELKHKLGLQASLDYVVARELASYGDYNEALENIDSALEKYAADGRNVIDNNYALARLLRSEIYLALGRQRDIRDEILALQHARRLNPALAGNTNEGQILVLAAIGSRDASAGVVRAKEYADSLMAFAGSDSSVYKSARAVQVLAETLNSVGTDVETIARTYLNEFSTSETQVADGSERGRILEGAALQRLLDLTIDRPETHSLAFKAAEILRTDSSQSALLAGAAKMAASNPELRALIDRERAAAAGRATARREAIQSDGKLKATEGATTGASAIERLRSDANVKAQAFDDSQKNVIEIRRQISSKFPRYRELVSPSIPTVAEIAQRLRSDEVYVNLFPGRDSGYGFLVDSSGTLSAWRVPISRQQTAQLVRRWRAPLDAGKPPADQSASGGLDLAAGRSIYEAWLEPIAKKAGPGKTLLLATSGPLAAVPWAALPLPESADGVGKVHWAIESLSFVTMPSASSLVLTRTLQARKASKPLIAFADPVFDNMAAATSSTTQVVMRRAAVPAELRFAADLDYRQLTRLPETLDEVKLIALAIGATGGDIISGAEATRSRVLREDLTDARVVVFATHGLSLGEVPGFESAGLALAFEGRGFEDSVLTVEDVANLRLNADVVLLSACNTGLTTGAIGDSVSSLARSFFVAGARSLMVTAWPVETESAKQLAAGTFSAMERPNTSHPNALATTQRAMLNGQLGERFRHPFYWAPYFLVGDGTRN